MTDTEEKPTSNSQPSDATERGILFAHLLEPTHVGSGEGLGTIDRPVFRESTTGYPTIPGSTLKGVTRDAVRGSRTEEEAVSDDVFKAAFGTSSDTGGNQGCILWADFKVLFLPLRSLAGTFAWATSMLALSRFTRDLSLITNNEGKLADELHTNLTAFLASDLLRTLAGTTASSAVAPSTTSVLEMIEGPIVVEGFVLNKLSDTGDALNNFIQSLTPHLYEEDGGSWSNYFAERVLVLPDNTFTHACRNCLPVDANIRINPSTGVTTTGSLRYTEFLPAETLMYSPLTILKPLIERPDADLAWVKSVWHELFGDHEKSRPGKPVVQLGADESKGKGVAQLHYVNSKTV